jgi:hypothetical protein
MSRLAKEKALALDFKWRERQAPKEIDVYGRMVSHRSVGEK